MSGHLNGIFNRLAHIHITDKEVLKLVQKAMAPNMEVLQMYSMKT